MANKATRDQVLEVVEQFVGKESATYAACVRKLDAGSHPNEVIMWLKQRLRAIPAALPQDSNGAEGVGS